MADPMDQRVMQLLNRYWPDRQGRSQLEMLAMGGSQTTPLRQAAGLPNLMDRNMPPFTPQNVADGTAPTPAAPGPVGLPPAAAPVSDPAFALRRAKGFGPDLEATLRALGL